MGVEARVHYAEPGIIPRQLAVCGAEQKFGSFVEVTSDPELVTCTRCTKTLRYLKAVKGKEVDSK